MASDDEHLVTKPLALNSLERDLKAYATHAHIAFMIVAGLKNPTEIPVNIFLHTPTDWEAFAITGEVSIEPCTANAHPDIDRVVVLFPRQSMSVPKCDQQVHYYEVMAGCMTVTVQDNTIPPFVINTGGEHVIFTESSAKITAGEHGVVFTDRCVNRSVASLPSESIWQERHYTLKDILVADGPKQLPYLECMLSFSGKTICESRLKEWRPRDNTLTVPYSNCPCNLL